MLMHALFETKSQSPIDILSSSLGDKQNYN